VPVVNPVNPTVVLKTDAEVQAEAVLESANRRHGEPVKLPVAVLLAANEKLTKPVSTIAGTPAGGLSDTVAVQVTA
jgi:hypothetical protein